MMEELLQKYRSLLKELYSAGASHEEAQALAVCLLGADYVGPNLAEQTYADIKTKYLAKRYSRPYENIKFSSIKFVTTNTRSSPRRELELNLQIVAPLDRHVKMKGTRAGLFLTLLALKYEHVEQDMAEFHSITDITKCWNQIYKQLLSKEPKLFDWEPGSEGPLLAEHARGINSTEDLKRSVGILGASEGLRLRIELPHVRIGFTSKKVKDEYDDLFGGSIQAFEDRVGYSAL